ncbi:hypothetical protein J3R30DRAFT_2189977 [Lentinula aciculospora]|uniref:Uncharacterized protein n=1 Tax=Lentinula aciculospora TaxID=153920 RepID=A0A9W9DRZ0_9AGAR|nr:hypothetical protein J3R30DRAFT_2189977 [Lentinula aciculospora]
MPMDKKHCLRIIGMHMPSPKIFFSQVELPVQELSLSELRICNALLKSQREHISRTLEVLKLTETISGTPRSPCSTSRSLRPFVPKSRPYPLSSISSASYSVNRNIIYQELNPYRSSFDEFLSVLTELELTQKLGLKFDGKAIEIVTRPLRLREKAGVPLKRIYLRIGFPRSNLEGGQKGAQFVNLSGLAVHKGLEMNMRLF